MPLLATITLPMSRWVWLPIALLPVALALLVWSYRRAPRPAVLHGVAFCLKLLGLLALALCLIEPLWSGRQAKSGANLFVVLADNSRGMTIRDRGVSQTRAATLQAALEAGRSDWLARLADNFQIRQYAFDSRLRRMPNFAELSFDGTATALGTTLTTLAQRYRGRPLAGILLLTDAAASVILSLLAFLTSPGTLPFIP